MTTTTTLTPLQRFFKLIAPDSKDIFYIYVYAIFNGLINLSLPLGIQAIIGLTIGGRISTSWTLLIFLVTLGVLISGGLQIVQLIITESLQQRIFTRSAFEFAYRIPRFKLEALGKNYAPELTNRFFDTLSLQKGIAKILIDFSTASFQILFGLFLIAFYNPLFIFFGFSLVGLLALILRLTGPKGMESSLKESKYKYEVAHWLEEVARVMHTFKLSGTSTLALKKTDELVQGYLKARKKHFGVLLLQFQAMVVFRTLITGSLLILGSYLIVTNRINIGQFVAAEIVIILVLNAVEKLIKSLETIYDVLTAVEKIGLVTDLPIEEDTGMSFAEIDTHEGLHLKAIDLGYTFADDGKIALQNINFEARPGERICITGESGSGKSTLIGLISGLFTDFSGSITYNGIPLRNMNINSLRAYIGDHSPKEALYKGTLRENICMGKPHVQLADVLQAADHIGLRQFIQRLPQGLETVIEPLGASLPDSISKKIILARAIVDKPRLLAMEVFMDGLPRNEKDDIINFLTDKSNNWTLVLVSNDPNVAAMCDRVLQMKEGKIVEVSAN